jgi:hypothetical protein
MVLGEGRWLVLSIIVGNFYEYVWISFFSFLLI